MRPATDDQAARRTQTNPDQRRGQYQQALPRPRRTTGNGTNAMARSSDRARPTAAIPGHPNLHAVASDEISADRLKGTTVYGANNKDIGEIGDVVLTTAGKVDAIVVDVGGFLGIGQKPVAISMDNLQFMQDANGNWFLYTNFTGDELKNQPAYNPDTYSQNRDKQLLTYTR